MFELQVSVLLPDCCRCFVQQNAAGPQALYGNKTCFEQNVSPKYLIVASCQVSQQKTVVKKSVCVCKGGKHRKGCPRRICNWELCNCDKQRKGTFLHTFDILALTGHKIQESFLLTNFPSYIIRVMGL